MHEAPARIDVRMIEQPGDRTLPAPGDAVRHFAQLLGDVDVHGRGDVDSRETRERGVEAIRRNRTQRMRGEPDPLTR